jgi:hypothetical protein
MSLANIFTISAFSHQVAQKRGDWDKTNLLKIGPMKLSSASSIWPAGAVGGLPQG